MDPLRPFTGLIRTLWKAGGSAAAPDADAPGSAPVAEMANDPEAGAVAEATLRSSLRLRLLQVGLADPRRARATFVETVLAAELGDHLSQDSAFAELVTRVADQIAADPRLGGRLQALLEVVVADAPAG